jgi:hypothetical protein
MADGLDVVATGIELRQRSSSGDTVPGRQARRCRCRRESAPFVKRIDRLPVASGAGDMDGLGQMATTFATGTSSVPKPLCERAEAYLA